MAQVKIYGLKESINPIKKAMSDTIHASLMESFGIPEEKRFQRFILLDEGDFIYPADRSGKYTIIEINTFRGRSDDAKRKLVKDLYKSFKKHLNFDERDLEITIMDSPAVNWGIRGKQGDELLLKFKAEA